MNMEKYLRQIKFKNIYAVIYKHENLYSCIERLIKRSYKDIIQGLKEF